MKNKHNIQYPNLPSAIRPILHQPDVPVPTPPPVLIDVEDSTTSSDLSSSECQSEYECFGGERPRLFSQEELNDLVRDLDLPKVSAVLLGSRLKSRNMLDFEVTFSWYKLREKEYLPFFTQEDDLVDCVDIKGLIMIIIIIFIYLPSDVISQEKKLQLPLGLSPKHRNMQFL